MLSRADEMPQLMLCSGMGPTPMPQQFPAAALGHELYPHHDDTQAATRDAHAGHAQHDEKSALTAQRDHRKNTCRTVCFCRASDWLFYLKMQEADGDSIGAFWLSEDDHRAREALRE